MGVSSVVATIPGVIVVSGVSTLMSVFPGDIAAGDWGLLSIFESREATGSLGTSDLGG
jgi:hypothetical protein